MPASPMRKGGGAGARRRRPLPHRRSPSAAASVALLLLLLLLPLPPSSLAAVQRPFLDRYRPTTDVDEYASLDVDLRDVANRLDAATITGKMGNAIAIYEEGRYDGEHPEGRATLQGLSTQDPEAFRTTSATFRLYEAFYGRADYADRWVRAAFEGNSTEFGDGKDFDFGEFGLEGRAAAIRRGMVVLHVWINVVLRLEAIAGLCPSFKGEEFALLLEWDRAVALYVGSRARDDGEDGHFPYNLAQDECAAFGTCGTGEMADVNDGVFAAFSDGKDRLQRGDCDGVARTAADARRLMTVPLVQGTLRAMHAPDGTADEEAKRGTAAAMMASVLPLVDDCHPVDAHVVHYELMPGRDSPRNFATVKAALERSYACWGIRCDDVGGILTRGGEGYHEGARPCGHVPPPAAGTDGADDESYGDTGDDAFVYGEYDRPPPPARAPGSASEPPSTGSGMAPTNVALLAGLVCGIVGILGGAAVTVACKRRRRKKQSQAEFFSPAGGNGAMEEHEVL